MGWTFLRDKRMYVKGMLVDDKNAKTVAKIYNERYGDEGTEMAVMRKGKKEEFFEPGGYGMYALNQPRMKFDILGKTLRLDCARITQLLTELNRCENELPGGLYMFASRFVCMVLDAEEVKALKTQLKEKMAEARRLSDNFSEKMEKAWQEQGLDDFIIRYDKLAKKNSTVH